MLTFASLPLDVLVKIVEEKWLDIKDLRMLAACMGGDSAFQQQQSCITGTLDENLSNLITSSKSNRHIFQFSDSSFSFHWKGIEEFTFPSDKNTSALETKLFRDHVTTAVYCETSSTIVPTLDILFSEFPSLQAITGTGWQISIRREMNSLGKRVISLSLYNLPSPKLADQLLDLYPTVKVTMLQLAMSPPLPSIPSLFLGALTSLQIDNASINNAAVAELLSQAPCLREFHVEGKSTLGDGLWTSLFTHCPRLQNVSSKLFQIQIHDLSRGSISVSMAHYSYLVEFLQLVSTLIRVLADQHITFSPTRLAFIGRVHPDFAPTIIEESWTKLLSGTIWSELVYLNIMDASPAIAI